MSGQLVVVLGETAVDVLVACGPDGPRWGQAETLVEDARIALGSSGAITAASLASLGCAVSFVGVVGDDDLGRYFLDELKRLGVDTSAVRRRAGGRTGMTVALEHGGDRAMLTYLGTMADLTVDDVPPGLLARADHLHVSSYFLQTSLHSGLRPLLETARHRGATTSLDPGWDTTLAWTSGIDDALGAVDWFLPNETEASAILARRRPSCLEADAVRVADTLSASLAGGIAIKRGGAGAVLARNGETFVLSTEPLVPVDTTGAGDNFNAGFIASCLAGKSINETLAMAVACGRHAIGGRGGTSRLATLPTAETEASRLAGQVRKAPSAPSAVPPPGGAWTAAGSPDPSPADPGGRP